MSAPVYLDHNATTPLDPRVVEAMTGALHNHFANPSSRHELGYRARDAVERARCEVARLINARPEAIYFTSGATEANNLVLRGAAERRGKRSVLVTSEIEHPSVLEPAESLGRRGVVVRLAASGANGIVLPEQVAALVDGETFLVSVMLANNETGMINPVVDYVPSARSDEAMLHTDATQAVGHVAVDVQSLDVDLMSFSAHKMYGPKGVGALYASRSARQRIEPQIVGGGHERGFRSGTLNVPAIVGFGIAATIAREEMGVVERKIAHLRNLLSDLLKRDAGEMVLNGALEKRLPGNLSVSFPGIDAASLVARLRHTVAFSTGAACSSAKVEPSHVLMALLQDDDLVTSSVRFGVGRYNTEEEIRVVAKAVTAEVRVLRGISVR